MVVGQKNTKKYVFELKSDIFEIGGKWSLEKPVLWPKYSAYAAYFRMYRRETKFSYKNEYRKIVFTHSFPRNKLFLISDTIRDIIYWNFYPKTRKTETFTLT